MKFDGNVVFLILIFAAVFTAGQAVIGLFTVATTKRRVNKRLKVAERVDGVQALVMELRKQRGLNAAGERSNRLRWLSNLIVSSGVAYEPQKWALYVAGLTVAGGLVAAVVTKNPLMFLLGAPVLWPLRPLFLPEDDGRPSRQGAWLPVAAGP